MLNSFPVYLKVKKTIYSEYFGINKFGVPETNKIKDNYKY